MQDLSAQDCSLQEQDYSLQPGIFWLILGASIVDFLSLSYRLCFTVSISNVFSKLFVLMSSLNASHLI